MKRSSTTKNSPINSAMHKSSLPPDDLPLMAIFFFCNAFSGRVNAKPKKLSCSNSMVLVLFLPQSAQCSRPKRCAFHSRLFITLTYAILRECVVSTPMRSTPGSHRIVEFGMLSRHSWNRCSASNPRLHSTIMHTLLQVRSSSRDRTISTSFVLYGSLVCRTSAPRIYSVKHSMQTHPESQHAKLETRIKTLCR